MGWNWRKATLRALLATHGGAHGVYKRVRLSGLLVAISGTGAVALVHSWGANDVIDIVAIRVLVYAAWLYGVLGLHQLMSPESRSLDGQQLARLRGLPPPTGTTRAVGLTLRLAMGMYLAGLPAMLTTLLLSPNGHALAVRLLQTALAIVFLTSLAALLALIASVAERAARRTPRLATALVVLVPWLVSWVEPGTPNLISAYGWMVERMIALGGSVS